MDRSKSIQKAISTSPGSQIYLQSVENFNFGTWPKLMNPLKNQVFSWLSLLYSYHFIAFADSQYRNVIFAQAVWGFRHTALFTPQNAATSRSNSFLFGSVVIHPDLKASATCSISASVISDGKNGIFTGSFFLCNFLHKNKSPLKALIFASNYLISYSFSHSSIIQECFFVSLS